MLWAWLIGEVSLLVALFVDGAVGVPALFDAPRESGVPG